jgi:hypothetical protein
MSRARAARLRRENAKKAKAAANRLFPGEKWIKAEDGIYLSPRRAVGKKSNYEHELRDARILRGFGSTIYFVPENSRQEGKKYDAIVDGKRFEFKNIGGNTNTLEHQFLRSRSQAPNVFINLEKTALSKEKIMSTLYRARNKAESAKSHGYAYYNKYKGGEIILKINGLDHLVYVNVDSLKIPGQ